MSKHLIGVILALILGAGETAIGLASSSAPLTVDEAKPILEVLSKLQSVQLVDPSPYVRMAEGWPYICWLAKPEFGAVNSVSWRFKGKMRWFLVSDLPRICLMPEVPADAPDPEAPEWPEFAHSFRAAAVQELPIFGRFLEEALGLKHKQSLGYFWSKMDLELPLVEDRDGPGRPVALVADPDQYSGHEGVPTSNFDRALHYWITDEEYQFLYNEIAGIASDRDAPLQDQYALLRRVAEGSYTSVVIKPEEVPDLAAECTKMETATSNTKLHDALQRILSVCRSAMNHRLGICIPGG